MIRASKRRNLRWTLSSCDESDAVYGCHRIEQYSRTGLTREQSIAFKDEDDLKCRERILTFSELCSKYVQCEDENVNWK